MKDCSVWGCEVMEWLPRLLLEIFLAALAGIAIYEFHIVHPWIACGIGGVIALAVAKRGLWIRSKRPEGEN